MAESTRLLFGFGANWGGRELPGGKTCSDGNRFRLALAYILVGTCSDRVSIGTLLHTGNSCVFSLQFTFSVYVRGTAPGRKTFSASVRPGHGFVHSRAENVGGGKTFPASLDDFLISRAENVLGLETSPFPPCPENDFVNSRAENVLERKTFPFLSGPENDFVNSRAENDLGKRRFPISDLENLP